MATRMLNTALTLSLRALATAGLTAGFAVLHLPLRVGRNAVESVLAAVLPNNVPGRLAVRRIDALSPRAIGLSGLSFADNHGRPLVEGVSFEARSPAALARAYLEGVPLPPLAVHVHRLRAFAPYLVIPPETPEERARRLASPSPAVRLSSVDITVDEVLNELNEVPLSATNVRAQLSVATGPGDAWEVRLRALDATVHAMGLAPERLHLELHAAHPSNAAALPVAEGRVTLGGEALDCALSVHLSADGRLDARMPRCAPSRAALDHAAGSPVGMGVRLEDFSVAGPIEGDLALRGAVVVGSSRVPFEGNVSAAAQSLALTLAHLNLHAMRDDLPTSDLHGRIVATHRLLGDAHAITVDTLGLLATVVGVPVPPAEAAARVRGNLLTLEHLRALSVGLDARGVVNRRRRNPAPGRPRPPANGVAGVAPVGSRPRLGRARHRARPARHPRRARWHPCVACGAPSRRRCERP